MKGDLLLSYRLWAEAHETGPHYRWNHFFGKAWPCWVSLVFSSKTSSWEKKTKHNTVKRRKLYSKNKQRMSECMNHGTENSRIYLFPNYFYQEESRFLYAPISTILKLLAEEVLICVSFSNVESLWIPVSVSVSSFLSHPCSREEFQQAQQIHQDITPHALLRNGL